MQLQTTRFGSVDVKEEDFIQFPWGIPGFETVKRYILIQHKDGPFQWLQAVEEPALAFIVCPAGAFNIQLQVPIEKTIPIGLEQLEDLLILLMVILEREKKSMRLNVRGPLLLNASTRQACQWTMDAREVSQFVHIPPEALKFVSGSLS